MLYEIFSDRKGLMMTDLSGKKLPTVEQVEEIMKEWGQYSATEFADRFQLDQEMIEATLACLRKRKRASNKRESPAMACYRNDQLESIVRCAGDKHGYV